MYTSRFPVLFCDKVEVLSILLKALSVKTYLKFSIVLMLLRGECSILMFSINVKLLLSEINKEY